MKVRRRTAARILAEAEAAGRKLTADEKDYLSQPDAQDVKAGRKPRMLAETGLAYLKARQEVGLTWSATGRELAQAREARGIVKAKGKKAGFTAADIPVAEGKTRGEFLAACKAFKARFGVKVADARKQVGSEVAVATHVLDLDALDPEKAEAIRAILDPS